VSNYEKLADVSQMALMLTNTHSTLVTDSAASGTQFASGVYAEPTQLGVDYRGKPAETILEAAKKHGKSAGLITTVYLQDATPAVFAAHETTRALKDAIARDLIETAPDVMLGGGIKYFKETGSLDSAAKKGYEIVYNAADMKKLKSKKFIGLFGDEAMPFPIENNTEMPTLKKMTQKAVETLSQNKNGFFLMVEGGAIDWQEHSNDAGSLLHELTALDETVGWLKDWSAENKNTLLIVTADHETGGFGSSYFPLDKDEAYKKTSAGEMLYEGNTYFVSPKVLDDLYAQSKTFAAMKEEYEKGPKTNARLLDILRGGGLKFDGGALKNYDSFDDAVKALDKGRGIVWASQAHTSTPVPVLAYGPGQDNYRGIFHTTDLNKKMRSSFGF